MKRSNTMQIQVITGERETGKTRRLLAIQSDLANQGVDVPIVIGSNFTTPYFLIHIAERAIGGTGHFLADDCTRSQIKAVLELQARGDKSGIPEYMMFHLVQQA
jgi:phosphatidylserine/phosphatidylglycerophosphate/cardiolipin synthase-like enzyme